MAQETAYPATRSEDAVEGSPLPPAVSHRLRKPTPRSIPRSRGPQPGSRTALHGCCFEPALFLTAAAGHCQRVRHEEAIRQQNTGSAWVDGKRLEDLDFADDIMLLGNT